LAFTPDQLNRLAAHGVLVFGPSPGIPPVTARYSVCVARPDGLVVRGQSHLFFGVPSVPPVGVRPVAGPPEMVDLAREWAETRGSPAYVIDSTRPDFKVRAEPAGWTIYTTVLGGPEQIHGRFASADETIQRLLEMLGAEPMTEAEWLTCDDPARMLRLVRDKVTDRRLRLFGCACVRRVLPLLRDESVSRKTVEFAERFADGLATRNELHGRAWGPAGQAFAAVLWAAFDAAETAAEFAARVVGLSAVSEVPWGPGSVTERDLVQEMMSPEQRMWAAAAEKDERRAQAQLALDIFGNPFRPVSFDPRWRTADAVGLARGIYEERAFDRLPLLADALMDAGCDDEHLLAHARADGHVRGCRVVDQVLGKE
jgi:hypothetical protein